MNHLVRLIVIIVFALCSIGTAQAHQFAPSLLEVQETTPNTYNVVWKTPAQTITNVPLQPIWPDGCEVQSDSPAVREGTAVITRRTLECIQLESDGLVGQVLSVDGLAENQSSAIIILSLRDGRSYQRVLNTDTADFLVPTSPSQLHVVTQYPVLGFEHIWEGPDHLMFVFGLLLLVGGGARLLLTITAFTLGHSVTLAIVTLGAVEYPVPLIEFVIALSIFLLAGELSRRPVSETLGQSVSLFRRHPWWIAGGFGLLHGLGFAGALADIGLPQNNIPLALLFFNIGIELGQVAFVLGALLIWWLVKRLVSFRSEKLVFIPVYGLGVLSAMWCIERGLAL